MESTFRILGSILPVLLLFLVVKVSAQEAEPGKKARAQWEHEYKHLLGVSAGFTFVPLGDELDHYVVTDDQVERENALNLTLVGLFSASRYWDFFLGGGIETEQHDNLAVLRLGTQYSLHVGQHWALVPTLYFDFKENYNTWTFAVSLARKF